MPEKALEPFVEKSTELPDGHHQRTMKDGRCFICSAECIEVTELIAEFPHLVEEPRFKARLAEIGELSAKGEKAKAVELRNLVKFEMEDVSTGENAKLGEFKNRVQSNLLYEEIVRKKASSGIPLALKERVLSKYIDEPDNLIAKEFYERIANSPDTYDVLPIANNTGIPEPVILKVKQHLFKNIYEVEVGDFATKTTRIVEGRLAPHEGIAADWAWAMEKSRLDPASSQALNDFKALVMHEYFEASLMEKGRPLMNPNSWREHAKFGWGNNPSPKDVGHGAHYMSPIPRHSTSFPFEHFGQLHGKVYEGPPLKMDFSNIDLVLAEIVKLSNSK